MIHTNEGWFAYLVTYNFPPSSIYPPFIARYIVDSWIDLILKFLSPWCSGNHCWLGFSVRSHWITLAPELRLYPSMSRKRPLSKFCIKYPLSCLMNLHLWLYRQLVVYWIILSAFSKVPPGTSKALLDSLLIITLLLMKVLLFLTS